MALTTRLIERKVGFSLNASIKPVLPPPPPWVGALSSATNILDAPFRSTGSTTGDASAPWTIASSDQRSQREVWYRDVALRRRPIHEPLHEVLDEPDEPCSSPLDPIPVTT